MDTDKDPDTGVRSSAFALIFVGLAFAAAMAVVLIAVLVGGSDSPTERANVVSNDEPAPSTSASSSDQQPWERSPWEYDVDAVDFEWMGIPTFEANLADLGSDRIREIEFFLPPGDGDIAFAIRNPDPIRITGQGIAVRTDTFAQILRSSEAFEMPRPEECVDGQCRLFMWLTMGPQFLDTHPGAELLIWAGEGSAVTIEPVSMANLSDETFRR